MKKTNREHIILMVEDSPAVSNPVRLYLETQNYKVFIASKGSECLNLLQEHHPDLILLDLDLEGSTNGITILRALKDNETYCKVPVIICSGLATSEIVQKAKTIGACDFMVKPYDLDDLTMRIAKILSV